MGEVSGRMFFAYLRILLLFKVLVGVVFCVENSCWKELVGQLVLLKQEAFLITHSFLMRNKMAQKSVSIRQ